MQKFLIILFFILLNVFTFRISYAQLNLYLGKPYIINPLGEGEESPYANGPLFREDGFDCTTYVETILAQHKSEENKKNFMGNLLSIRYIDGKVNFFTRAHFMEFHWIPNAIKHDFIKPYPLSFTKNSKLEINLQTWFLENAFIKNKDEKYKEMAKQQEESIKSSIPFVPKERIDKDFLQTLPDFMVIFFIKEIRPNSWAGQEGKQELVTHMGILKNKEFYHASSKNKEVIKTSLLSYLENNPSFLGVSFYTINN